MAEGPQLRSPGNHDRRRRKRPTQDSRHKDRRKHLGRRGPYFEGSQRAEQKRYSGRPQDPQDHGSAKRNIEDGAPTFPE